ncbi:MAG: glycosyltransferase family 4 protein [Gammaproteobacteria bacterium]|nr:glycosyltransferase family 4 protein [Gammaproteobacteria bacterium]
MSAGVHSDTTIIWVNARFLDRPVTGVERVATELLGVLAERYLDEQGCWYAGDRRFCLRLIAPRGSATPSPWRNLRLVRTGVFRGHAWEQFDLPRWTRRQCLVSLCNTGPILKRLHILFLHDAQPFVIPKNFSLAFRCFYRTLFRIAGRFSQRILVNSRFTRRELWQHAGIPRQKMVLCYPGSDHVRQEKGLTDALSHFDLPQEPFLLAVASANQNKNFALIARALRALGDTAPPCVIVGRTDQRHFGGVSLDSARVTHLGYVSDAELLALYRRALCLVFPSFYEGFGLPPLEAMAAGCPVVVSRTSAMPEISGLAAEYCDPHDYQTLARAILTVAQSPLRRREMIEHGIERARNFSWHCSGRRLLELIADTA